MSIYEQHSDLCGANRLAGAYDCPCTSNYALRSCPFCGGKPEAKLVKVKAGYYVKCSLCDETGPIGKTKSDARAEWNYSDHNPRAPIRNVYTIK